MRPAGAPKGQRGLTLIEQLFALAMVGLMLVPLVNFIRDTRSSLLRSEGQAELLERNRRLGANLRTGLATTDLLLVRYPGVPDVSDMRQRVKASVAASGSPAVVAFSQAPLVQNATEPKLLAAPSPSSPNWGDELMYVANLQPLTFTVCYTGCTGGPFTYTARESVSVDRLQFVYIYLAQDPSAKLPSLPGGGLRLVEWRSQPYINYAALREFKDVGAKPRLTESLKVLGNDGYAWAFDKAAVQAPEDAFYRLSATGATVADKMDNSTSAPNVLPRGAWAWMDEFDYSADLAPKPGLDRGRIARAAGGGNIAGPADVMVALNTLSPTVSPDWKLARVKIPGKPQAQVPAYADGDSAGPGFPAGFEVAVWGRPSARELSVRRVLISVSGADRRAAPKEWPGHESTDFISVKNSY